MKYETEREEERKREKKSGRGRIGQEQKKPFS